MKKKLYQHIVPSTNQLLAFIEQADNAVSFKQLCIQFDIKNMKSMTALQKILYNLTKEKLVKKDKKGSFYLPIQKDLIEGIVSAHRDGYGFVIAKDRPKDVYLSSHEMQSLLDGDHVSIKLLGHNTERQSGQLVEVLKRGINRVVGQLAFERGSYFVEAHKKNNITKVKIKKQHLAGANIGEIVEVDITEYPSRKSAMHGVIKKSLGNADKKGIHTDIAIKTYELPNTWPEEVKLEIKKITSDEALDVKEIERRIDLRNHNLITIDGIDARDFDDAVYCNKTDDGWQLIVAIADVDFYVKPSSALDNEAHWRGTSVYFPDRVIPMLPEILSNGLCSLMPNVDRFTLVCDMQISENGTVVGSSFYEAVIKSQARLTYSQVNDFHEEKDNASIPTKIKPVLHDLFAMYGVMSLARDRRGAIDLDIPQSKIEFNKDGDIKNIDIVKRNDAHRLIEECMIAANVEAARFINKSKVPVLYRNHEKPEPEDFEQLRSYVLSLGMKAPHPQHLTPGDYNSIIKQTKNSNYSSSLSMTMLRSFKQAQYQADNIGHFGLALKTYTHFTSPIRRYPDLLVHRAIRHIATQKKSGQYHYTNDNMHNFGDTCSEKERRAEKATREVDAILKCRYMEDKVGLIFKGTVTSITNFGLFVQLDDTLIEGLVHISNLKNDYYLYDERSLSLVGERNKITYNIGDRLEVKVNDVDLSMRRINFSLMRKVSKDNK
jgi:ribonuclease R